MTHAEKIREAVSEIGGADRHELAEILSELGRAQGAVLAALVCLPPPSPDRLLTIKEAAEKMKVSVSAIYRKSDRYPFTVRDGARLRFSEHGIEEWARGGGRA